MSKSSKIKDAFTKNIGLKIVALILGSIIWLAVVNTSDPSTTVTVHNIPITITNQKAITKQGLVYDVTSKQKVDVTVSGNRSVVSGLTADDFKATASLKELSMVKAAPVTVKLKDRSNARRVNILSQNVNTVTIDINKVTKEKYPVEVKFIGKPAEGYVAKIKSMSFNNVLVKASEAAHKKIDKVVAKCDIDEADEDFSETYNLVFLDKDGKTIKPEHAKLYKKKVKVDIHLSQEKEVPIIIDTVGKPKAGYKSSIKVTPKNVKLVGDTNKLKKVDKLVIDDPIDIKGRSSNIELEINLDKYVEDGLYIEGSHTAKVKVTIEKK